MSKTGENQSDLSLDTINESSQPSVISLNAAFHFLPVSSNTGSYWLVQRNDAAISAACYKTSQISTDPGAGGQLGKLNDYYQSYLYLEAGTYFVTIAYYAGNDLSQVQLLLDNVNVTKTLVGLGGTYLDMYLSYAEKRIVPIVTSLTLTETKFYDIKLKTTGKNGAVGAAFYATPFQSINFVRMS